MYTLDYSDALLLYYLFFAKILPALVTFFFDKRFNIKIKFKSISLLNASIQNIYIKWAGYEISVAELGLKTKYFNSEYNKPLCIELEEVKINQTNENEVDKTTEKSFCRNKSEVFEAKEKNVTDNYSRKMKEFSTNFLNYVLQFIPPTTMIFLQFLEVQIKNFSTIGVNREKGPFASLAIPKINLSFDGCVVKNNRTLFIALALQHIKSKFYAYNKQNPSRKPHQACLAEVVFDCTLEARVVWNDGKLLYEKLHVLINNTQVTFYGGLFDMIEHVMLHTKYNLSSPSSNASEFELESVKPPEATVDVKHLIEKLTPNLIIIQVENTEVKSFNKSSSYHYHLLLQRIDVKGNFKLAKSTRTRISNLRIYTPLHEVMHLKELLVDGKLCQNIITSGIRINTLYLVYNHEDIHGWFKKIFLAGMKSNRRELIIKALKMINEKIVEFYYSEFIQSVFDSIILNNMTELLNITLVIELEDEISSLNASQVKFSLEQLDELRKVAYNDYTMKLLFKDRNWVIELNSDSPLCWFMDQKFQFLNKDSKKTYIRGSAIYIGNSFIRLHSHDDIHKLKLRLDTFRSEYSKKLTTFIVQSVKSYKEYIDLFGQLKNKEDEVISNVNKLDSIEMILKLIDLDMIISNISCFFINRHDVCVFINLKEFISTDSFNYILDTMEVSTVDFSCYDSVCDLSEFSSKNITTKMLKVNLFASNDQPQICVDFTTKLECSWNAHFLRHVLSLIRDFHRFKSSVESALGLTQKQKTLLPRSLPVALDIKKLRNIRIKHSD
ncbi:CLUMA_CG013464, isoform A, partial [Clunio marinus]